MSRTSLALLLPLLLSACATPSTRRATASDPDGPLQIIDAHTHTRFDGTPEQTSGIVQTQEQYARDLRDAGVVASISHTSHTGEGYVEALRSKNVIFCAGLPAKPNYVQLEADLKSGKFGCIKVYLGYVHQWAYDANYRPAYKLAEKYGVPVVFHTGDTYSTVAKLKYSDPLTIDEVAVDFPKVTFVIAHLGNPWIESAAEVAYKNPNVVLEVSAMLIGDLSTLPKEDVETYVVKPVSWIFGFVENPNKMMFGTDWPLAKISPYVDAIKRAIPKENWKAVFHDNAARVFKFRDPRDQLLAPTPVEAPAAAPASPLVPR